MNDELRRNGFAPHVNWLLNLQRNGRLLDRIEVDALASVLDVEPSLLDGHLTIAPWAIEQSKRAPMERPTYQARRPSSLINP